MRKLLLHRGLFSTGDNEAYSEVPTALLLTLGDERYAAFLRRESKSIRRAGLRVEPLQIRNFQRRFPQVTRLYRDECCFHASAEPLNRILQAANVKLAK